MSEIIYKSKNAIVVYKPPRVPSQPDSTGEVDIMSKTRDFLRESHESGELFPVHRLDTVVGGLLLFARNGESAARLSEQMQHGLFKKEYFAVVEGECKSGTMIDCLAKDTRINKAIVKKSSQNGAKYAELEYRTLAISDTPKGKRSLVRISLKTGRFHQIRAQFSSRSLPLVGDKKYGSRDFLTRLPALFSTHVETMLGEEIISATRLPDLTLYPWNLFSHKDYGGN